MTTEEYLSGRCGPALERVELWTHPLFTTSSQLRQEAATHFYQTNSFGLHHKAAFQIELCRSILPLNFFNSIRTLSVTLTSFSYGAKLFCSKVSLLKGLRNLNIYASWEKILWDNKPHRLAAEAFASLVMEHCAVPDTTSCFAVKQVGAFKEPYARFKHFRAEIEALELPAYRFAVKMFIFRRRSRELRASQSEAEEVAMIEDLIAVSRREIREVMEAKASEALRKEQEGGLRDLRDEKEETKYPLSFEILKDERFHIEAYHKGPFVFYTLNPILKINVYDCPLKGKELTLPKSDRTFHRRILDLKDPVECERELRLYNIQEVIVQRPRQLESGDGDQDEVVDARSMTREEIVEKLGEAMAKIDEVEDDL